LARFLIITTRTEKFDPKNIPSHHEYLGQLRDEGCLELSGPFADSSGGAYLIHAVSLEKATTVARNDPLVTSGSSTIVIKEWRAT